MACAHARYSVGAILACTLLLSRNMVVGAAATGFGCSLPPLWAPRKVTHRQPADAVAQPDGSNLAELGPRRLAAVAYLLTSGGRPRRDCHFRK